MTIPMLFEIGTHPESYLFGTHHAAPVEAEWILNKALELLPKVARVYLEPDYARRDSLFGLLPPKDLQAARQRLDSIRFLGDNKTLKGELTPEEIEEIAKILGKKVDEVQALTLSIWLLARSISWDPLNIQDSIPFDRKIFENAVAVNKPVIGLELTEEVYWHIYGPLIPEQQKIMLHEAMSPRSSEVNRKFHDAYQEGDYDACWELSKEAVGENQTDQWRIELDKRSLDDRNASWMAQIKEFLGKEPVLIAVGASHLGGPHGLVQLLKNENYSVEPVNVR